MISWNFKSRNLSPIGLDIGNYSIKMIQLAVSNNRIAVVAADETRIDHSINKNSEERRNFVVFSLQRMLANGKFRGKSVVSCLPSEKVRITSLRLAEMQPDKVEEALKKEAAERFGLDPDKDAINYLHAGSVLSGDEMKEELILFAAEDKTIKSHIAMLEEAGLQPVAIDVVPCAFFRSFERSLRRQEDKERTVIFLDIGSSFTTVAFGRRGEICFVKQIAIGGARFNREIGEKLGIDIDEVPMLRSRLQIGKNPTEPQPSPGGKVLTEDNGRLDAPTQLIMLDAITTVAEELAREISLCLRYYAVTFRGKRVEKVVFSGGEAYEGILFDILRQQLKIDVEIAQPVKGFELPAEMMNGNFDSDKQGLLSEWAVAVGLCLKGWNGNTCASAAVEMKEDNFEYSDKYERD
jgi:type IV pilus assembly protein PilM